METTGSSWPDQLVALSPAAAEAAISELSPEEIEALAYDWSAWRRPEQAPPPDPWRFWVILTGRGWGKTRTGSEWSRESALSGRFRYVNLIGATADDARDIMIEGESGILSICRRSERPWYRKSLRRLDWPTTGCRSLIFTADEPERLRGKQHQRFWADELASWRRDGEAWTQAKLGLRLPPDPRALVTTTPKPLAMLKKLMADPSVVVTQGTTYDNRANLDPAFFADVIREYEGTALGRQELEGHLLAEAEGALWRRAWIDAARVDQAPETLARVAVGVDPPGGAAECGIVAAALGEGTFKEADKYVLADASERLPAAEWGAQVWRLALDVGADIIAAERNFGGDMVSANLAAAGRTPEFAGAALPRVVLVNASRGKAVRAEPWATHAQQGRLHHVGNLDALEDELCTWIPGAKSPNRLDAMVWALAGLGAAPQELQEDRFDLWA